MRVILWHTLSSLRKFSLEIRKNHTFLVLRGGKRLSAIHGQALTCTVMHTYLKAVTCTVVHTYLKAVTCTVVHTYLKALTCTVVRTYLKAVTCTVVHTHTSVL